MPKSGHCIGTRAQEDALQINAAALSRGKDRAVKALIRLDTIMRFADPEQFYCFCPNDTPAVRAAWKAAALAVRDLK